MLHNNFCLYSIDTQSPGKYEFLAGHSIIQNKNQYVISKKEAY